MPESKEIYRIDEQAYKALKIYCLRYTANKLEIEDIMKSGGVGFAYRSKIEGKYSNPTENKAMKIMELEADCELIERMVKKVCEDYDVLAEQKNTLYLSDFILMNVTTFNQYNSYNSLKKRGYKIPVGKDLFYFIRFKFFYEFYQYFKDKKS
jgi:hypothetical protein